MSRRILLGAAAPALAAVIALVVTIVILLVTGNSTGDFLSVMSQAPKGRNWVNIVNNASVLYLAAIAAAIGFRMNLFNIGVEGQYRVAVFAAAVFGGQGWLPGPLNIVVALLLAMVTGGLWAAIAGALRVFRGVSEVIATIMLNAIAVSLTAYLLRQWGETRGTTITTTPIAEDSWVPGIPWPLGEATNEIFGLTLVAIVVGVGYWYVLNRTRFGFELRATGASPTAAVANGIDVRRMMMISMVLSGAVAGLVAMPILFGDAHAFTTNFQAGLGFTGIAVALLGRNSALGIAFGALLFSWLSEQSSQLSIVAGISDDLVLITQGVLVLSVVVAYEIVRRVRVAQEQRAVASALAEERTDTDTDATTEAAR